MRTNSIETVAVAFELEPGLAPELAVVVASRVAAAFVVAAGSFVAAGVAAVEAVAVVAETVEQTGSEQPQTCASTEREREIAAWN